MCTFSLPMICCQVSFSPNLKENVGRHNCPLHILYLMCATRNKGQGTERSGRQITRETMCSLQCQHFRAAVPHVMHLDNHIGSGGHSKAIPQGSAQHVSLAKSCEHSDKGSFSKPLQIGNGCECFVCLGLRMDGADEFQPHHVDKQRCLKKLGFVEACHHSAIIISTFQDFCEPFPGPSFHHCASHPPNQDVAFAVHITERRRN